MASVVSQFPVGWRTPAGLFTMMCYVLDIPFSSLNAYDSTYITVDTIQGSIPSCYVDSAYQGYPAGNNLAVSNNDTFTIVDDYGTIYWSFMNLGTTSATGYLRSPSMSNNGFRFQTYFFNSYTAPSVGGIRVALVKTSDGIYVYGSTMKGAPIADMVFNMPSAGHYGYYHLDSDKVGTIQLTIPAKNGSTMGQIRGLINALMKNAIVNPQPPDPYEDIPESTVSEPSGTYDFQTTDDISFPQMPQLSAVSTGFISLWSPTEDQMLKLSSFMWNANPLTIDFWKKLVADPMKLIYGLNIIPLDLEAMGLIDGEGTPVVGLIDTRVPMNHLSTQWVELDCGTIDIDETWSAYLDYDPYTKLEIYLPYCGTHPLKIDDFMPGAISLKYHIDLLSGACVAILVSTKSDKHGDTLNSVVYQFMGNCASQIPVTSDQYADAVRSVIQLAASIGTMVALGAGGAGAGAAVASTAMPTAWGHFDSPLHTTNALSTQVAGLVPAQDSGPIDWRGFMPSATPSVAETASQAGGILKKIGGIHAASAAVENVMGIKPNIERSGAIGSTGGLLSVQIPYLIMTRPRQARPKDQNKYTGYPSFITETLGDLTGWTIVQAIHLENIACTAEELAEIDELLKSGVIF